MPRVRFTPNLARHLDAPSVEVAALTVHEALEAVFASNPSLRSYVLDDQGRLRRHVVVFVDGELIEDRARLSDPVGTASELFVLQALSGG